MIWGDEMEQDKNGGNISLSTSIREPALLLKQFDDITIQALLREVPSQTMVNFLWYMKDAALLKLVLNNYSQRTAQGMMRDLNQQWRGINPATASESDIEQGQYAVHCVMNIYQGLLDSGEVDNVLEASK